MAMTSKACSCTFPANQPTYLPTVQPPNQIYQPSYKYTINVPLNPSKMAMTSMLAHALPLTTSQPTNLPTNQHSNLQIYLMHESMLGHALSLTTYLPTYKSTPQSLQMCMTNTKHRAGDHRSSALDF